MQILRCSGTHVQISRPHRQRPSQSLQVSQQIPRASTRAVFIRLGSTRCRFLAVSDLPFMEREGRCPRKALAFSPPVRGEPVLPPRIDRLRLFFFDLPTVPERPTFLWAPTSGVKPVDVGVDSCLPRDSSTEPGRDPRAAFRFSRTGLTKAGGGRTNRCHKLRGLRSFPGRSPCRGSIVRIVPTHPWARQPVRPVCEPHQPRGPHREGSARVICNAVDGHREALAPSSLSDLALLPAQRQPRTKKPGCQYGMVVAVDLGPALPGGWAGKRCGQPFGSDEHGDGAGADCRSTGIFA